MPKNIKQTLQGADMDITSYKMSYKKLKERIVQDVKDTQLFVGRHLPDKLFMSFDQFKLLEDNFQRLGETAYRIYVTPYNVMEVHIIDAPEWVDVEALTGFMPDDERELEEVAKDAGWATS